MAEAIRGRVYTVRAGRPFMTALAQALLQGTFTEGKRPATHDPLALADLTLMLPSRGMVTALQAAFMAAAGGEALLLPRIKPIADTQTELDVLTSAEDLAAAAATGSQRVIGQLERQLALIDPVFLWARQTGKSTTPAQAVHLAKELALLMDMLETQGLGAEALGKIVPEELSEHWKLTLKFLEIMTHFWPQHLEEIGALSPVAHRHRILRAEIARLEAHPPREPVIIAGVTALDPVAVDLARAVLALPNGALVLPALDQACDDATWAAIMPKHPEHPQFGLAKLLADLGVSRADVTELSSAPASQPEAARARFVSEAMRPAETTEHWHHFVVQARSGAMPAALAEMHLVEAATAEEEAEAIALMLREAAELPGKTAALVTPDRNLARRVSVRLRAWGLRVPISGGTPFTQTQSGAFLDLVIDAAAHGFAPRAVCDLLKHGMTRAGLPEQVLHAGVRTLELAVFRQPYFGEGLDGLLRALDRAYADRAAQKRRHPSVERLTDSDWEAARALVKALELAFRPLLALFADDTPRTLADLVRAHTNAAQQLTPAEGLWFGPAGEWGSKFFAKLMEADLKSTEMAAEAYPEFYRALVAEKSLSVDGPQHPRLSIWDPFEARLKQPDLVILGGLNEATWPAGAEPGPWLNRPMRASLGLAAPEERIGSAAHDFATLLCAPRVVLTRAAKVDGSPTVPSRWLLRLEALRNGLSVQAPQGPWLAWAAHRNAIDGPVAPVRAPMPRPPVHLRPRRLSVTAIEKWFANPYALYAQRILRLEPLQDVGHEPGGALRGEIIHDALGKFARAYPDTLPDDIAGTLVGFAEEALRELTGSPRVAAFWAPRFERFAHWFAETEPDRRKGTSLQLAEISGAHVITAGGEPFTLTARADRIDLRTGSGGLAVIITDYKSASGIKELAGRAARGVAPQLPLEAAIALAGGFAGVGSPARKPNVEGLRYISASGGEPPGLEVAVKIDDIAGFAGKMLTGLESMVAAFSREETPYAALRRPAYTYDYDDYAHLARIAEWSSDTPEEA